MFYWKRLICDNLFLVSSGGWGVKPKSFFSRRPQLASLKSSFRHHEGKRRKPQLAKDEVK